MVSCVTLHLTHRTCILFVFFSCLQITLSHPRTPQLLHSPSHIASLFLTYHTSLTPFITPLKQQQDLKQEIKHTLQNKLHRNAGPEDLVAAEAMLQRVQGKYYCFGGLCV